MWEFIRENPAALGTAAALFVAVIEFLRFLGVATAISEAWKRWITVQENSSPVGAELDVEFRNRPTKSSDWIVVQNFGDQTAEEVVLSVEADTPGGSPLASNDYRRKTPAVLEPGQDIKFMAATTKQCHPPHDVTLDWKDERGHHQKKKTIYQ